MPKIKFSHRTYAKLNGIDTSRPIRLIAVVKTRFDKLPETFRRYDTEYRVYREDNYYYDTRYYDLPKTDLLMLVFMAGDSEPILFTTLRRWTPQNQDFYDKNIGELFEFDFSEQD